MRVASTALLITAVLAQLIGIPRNAQIQEDSTIFAQLEVRLSVSPERYVVGEAVPLMIQIANRDEVAVYLPSRLSSLQGYCSHVAVSVSDDQGTVSPVRVGRVFYSASDSSNREPALKESWVALQPGHFFGRTFLVDGKTFPLLNRPGRYEISATYVLDPESRNSPCGISGKEIEEIVRRTGWKTWRGKMKSNPLFVEILQEGR